MVMVENKGKIQKVTIEYENVTFIAEGEDAERWLQWIDKIEFLAAALGRSADIKWTDIREKQHEKSDSKGK